MATNIIKYETTLGEVELSPEIIKKYLVNGDGNITDQEVFMFLNLCKYQKLNPFLREAYLIKYGNNKPATMVTGKETFLKRAVHNPKYKGHTTGISEDGKKAWADVYVEGYTVPIHVEVDWSEYVGRKGDGTVTKMWVEKGRTMLKKVALVQALRESFPEDFGGLYSPEEINSIDSAALPAQSINAEATVVENKPQTEVLKDKLKGKEDLTAEKQQFEQKCSELGMSTDEITAFKKHLFRKAPSKSELMDVITKFTDLFDEFVAAQTTGTEG